MESDSPLTDDTREQVKQFLDEYHQHYSWGCPPNFDWTVEDCKRFNSEYKRILNLVLPEIQKEFIVCIEQFDLMEEQDSLEEFYRRGREFVLERMEKFYHCTYSE